MNDLIQNLVATIASVEDTGTQIKIKDSNKKSLGSFFKLKKDGTPSQAFQQFQNMQIKSGDTVEIGFKETPDKTNPKIVYKNIIGFREAAGRPAQAPVALVSAQNAPQRTISPIADKQDAFGRRLALHGFINARLGTHTIEQVKAELPELLKLEDKINELLEGDPELDFLAETIPFQ